jgi:hypothetical protein
VRLWTEREQTKVTEALTNFDMAEPQFRAVIGGWDAATIGDLSVAVTALSLGVSHEIRVVLALGLKDVLRILQEHEAAARGGRS